MLVGPIASRQSRIENPRMTTTTTDAPLSAEELNKIDAYWRAANYLSVGQIYLMTTRSCGNR